MDSIQRDSKELESQLKNILGKYEELYKFGNQQYVEERSITGSLDGLEDFYILVQTIRRNRDVIGSLIRGISSLRNLSRYKFVEQDIPVPAKPKKKRGVKIHPQPESETQPPELPPEMTEPEKKKTEPEKDGKINE
jgi:hypothetical protein